MYVSNSIIYTLSTDLIFTCENYEYVWLEISMGKNNESLLVGLIYCHPGNSTSDFTKQLSEFLLVINLFQNKEACIFGDININSLKKDTETSIKNYFNEIHGLASQT